MHISDVHDYGLESKEAEEFLSQNRKEQIKKEVAEIVNDEFDRLEHYANDHITELAAGRAERFLERVLNGDEDAAMALMGDRSNGSRYRNSGYDKGKPWASVIHGTVFESGGVRLRREIVEAHAELLQSERVKDLESIVEGLREQVVSLEQQLDDTRRRVM